MLVHVLCVFPGLNNTTMPLKVIIAGAGLGGLGAAIALARAGHNIEV